MRFLPLRAILFVFHINVLAVDQTVLVQIGKLIFRSDLLIDNNNLIIIESHFL